ncbi:hypothetical protein ACRAWF_38340 [Streptomyces sp. L7]
MKGVGQSARLPRGMPSVEGRCCGEIRPRGGEGGACNRPGDALFEAVIGLLAHQVVLEFASSVKVVEQAEVARIWPVHRSGFFRAVVPRPACWSSRSSATPDGQQCGNSWTVRPVSSRGRGVHGDHRPDLATTGR